MFSLFKKSPERKFVIILSAGRCGSTYLVEELNKIPSVNIYGENYNVFSKITQAMSAVKETLYHAKKCNKTSKIPERKKYKGNSFIYVEWYNDIKKLNKLFASLERSIDLYFKDKSTVCGFKEIRFEKKEDIESLEYFEKKYKTYYIHLTRNIEDQANSAFWKDVPSARDDIIKINGNISEVLSKKNRYLKIDLSEISKDISRVKEFIEI